jgi:PAS domain S-box-containing protein
MCTTDGIPDPTPIPLDAQFAAIVASSDDAIVSKDLSGIVRSWNPSAERIFGYSAAEMVGKSITVLFPPDRMDEEPQILERLKRGERVDHFQTVRMHKDGRRLLVSVTISPIRDATGRVVGASKVARDITRTSELEGMFGAIVAGSDDAIVSKDLSGIVRSWNPSAERIFGYTAAEMVGKSITVLFPPDRLDEEPQILERLKRGERVEHFETVRIRKDGRPVEVSVTISPVKGVDGRVVGASKVARDITELKRLMREREQMLEAEQAARREAERVSRMKDEFLATLSHELRTPLNAILGWVHLLRNPSVPPDEARQGMETIERNARLQAQLVEDLLDMSRIVSGKVRLDVRDVDLLAVISDAVESARPAADAKQIRLNHVLDPNAGHVSGDPNRLQQVIWNLLTNAVKFTPRGGRVQVFLQRVNSRVEVTVSDNGEGVARKFLPHLFERFSQADASITRRHGGLGLGLAIVRHLTELHGGTVRAASAGKGRGSDFVVSLPVKTLRAENAGGTHPTAEAPLAGRLAQMDLEGVKVLVVDDDVDSRDLVRRVLEKRKAIVTVAASAAEALALLQEVRPDVLISDIGMPAEDGYQLLAKVRRLAPEEGGDTPAVALTAFARSEDRRRALMAGFQMHVAKPAEPAELLAAVANLAGTAGPGSLRR